MDKKWQQMDEPLRDMVEIIHFTQNASAKIHGVLDEAEIYRTVIEEFAQSKAYTASILLLTDDESKLGIAETSLSPAKRKAGEEASGVRLKGYQIDLNQSSIYRQVVREGKTVQADVSDLIGEMFPRPLAYLISKTMGYDKVPCILTRLERHGKAIGALAVSSTHLAEYFVPSVRTLAEHISAALELADEYAERKRAEEAVRESEERYRSLFDHVPVGLYRTKPDGQILDANLALVEMFGHPDRESLLMVNAVDFYVDPKDRRRERALLDQEGLVLDFETRLRRRDGTTIWARDNVQAIRGADGRVLYHEGILEDITERKRMEQYVIRTERLAAMGHMAAALAHEIKNPLHAVHSHLELVLDFPLQRDERDEYLRFCCQEIERLTEITERVLGSARSTGDVPCPASIADLMQRVLALVNEPLQHARAQVTTDFPADLPPVLVVPDRIVQVLLNLVINAIEAVCDGGHIHVTARVDEETMDLTLTNDGPPIPVEHIERIFEPFFTSKPNGAGLGLFISHNIVQQHGGTISVANLEDDQGVAFTMTLPIAPSADAHEVTEGAES